MVCYFAYDILQKEELSVISEPGRFRGNKAPDKRRSALTAELQKYRIHSINRNIRRNLWAFS